MVATEMMQRYKKLQFERGESTWGSHSTSARAKELLSGCGVDKWLVNCRHMWTYVSSWDIVFYSYTQMDDDNRSFTCSSTAVHLYHWITPWGVSGQVIQKIWAIQRIIWKSNTSFNQIHTNRKASFDGPIYVALLYAVNADMLISNFKSPMVPAAVLSTVVSFP